LRFFYGPKIATPQLCQQIMAAVIDRRYSRAHPPVQFIASSSAPHRAAFTGALGVRGFPDTKIPFSPTVQDSGFPIILTPMRGLAWTSPQGRIGNRPGRSENGLKEIMQNQQAVCLAVRETEARCPGAGFSVWRIESRVNRVAAVARAGAGFSTREIEAPIRDTNFNAAPELGSVLPVIWAPETSWPAGFQRWKPRQRPPFEAPWSFR
jgi:hypothetical protein